jgi:xanthine permease XanP
MPTVESSLERLWAPRDHPSRRKPPELIYGVEDVPPFATIVLSGLQHVGLITIFLIFPLAILNEVGAPVTLATNILCLAAIALGFGTLLQSLSKGPVGSGFLCPANYSAIYLGPSLAAAKLGGLPMLFGMTIFAGAIEAALTPLLRRLRSLFPPELSGLVIFLVGTTVGSLGFRYLVGSGAVKSVTANDVLVALVTLGVTIGLNVWGKGRMRLFCALVGMILGYITALLVGILSPDEITAVAMLPIVALPNLSHISWSFSPGLALPFVIAAVVAAVKCVAVITFCQRINDSDWVRPEPSSLGRGVLADGLGTLLSGIFGSMGINSSPTSAGLAAATGVASRQVGFATAGVLIVLGFFPIVIGFLVMMPRPILGSLLVFTACFILVNGIQTMASRIFNARRTLVVGIALSAGVAAEILPNTSVDVPVLLQPLVSSSLVVGTITALVLNVLFRIGETKHIAISLHPAGVSTTTQIGDFFDERGRDWAARRDVMDRVSFGAQQACEAICEMFPEVQTIGIDARFDEFNVDVRLTYKGEPIHLPERSPSVDEIVESEQGHLDLAGYMLRKNADRVAVTRIGEETTLLMHFDH